MSEAFFPDCFTAKNRKKPVCHRLCMRGWWWFDLKVWLMLILLAALLLTLFKY